MLMHSLREPLYMNNDSSKIIFAHAEALLKDKKVFQYLLKSKKYKDNLCVGGGGEGALEVGQELSDKGYQHYQVSNRGRAMILQAVVILLSYCFVFQLNLGWLRGMLTQ